MMTGVERSAVRRISNNGAYKLSLCHTIVSSLPPADGWWEDLLVPGVQGYVIHVHCQSSRRKGGSCCNRLLEPPECFSASDGETFATSYESQGQNSWCVESNHFAYLTILWKGDWRFNSAYEYFVARTFRSAFEGVILFPNPLWWCGTALDCSWCDDLSKLTMMDAWVWSC